MDALQKSGYLCHPQQLYTLRRITIDEGKAKGTSIIEVCTAGGLQLDILPDAGLDIGQVRYKGVNVAFISKNGYDSPAAIDHFVRIHQQTQRQEHHDLEQPSQTVHKCIDFLAESQFGISYYYTSNVNSQVTVTFEQVCGSKSNENQTK